MAVIPPHSLKRELTFWDVVTFTNARQVASKTCWTSWMVMNYIFNQYMKFHTFRFVSKAASWRCFTNNCMMCGWQNIFSTSNKSRSPSSWTLFKAAILILIYDVIQGVKWMKKGEGRRRNVRDDEKPGRRHFAKNGKLQWFSYNAISSNNHQYSNDHWFHSFQTNCSDGLTDWFLRCRGSPSLHSLVGRVTNRMEVNYTDRTNTVHQIHRR